jgi:hypothetical protein
MIHRIKFIFSILILSFLICQVKNSDDNSTILNVTNPSSGQSIVCPSYNQNCQNNQSSYNDVLLYSIFYSNLTQDQRNEYLYWVKYKNSFAADAGQLAALTTYFAPESSTYYEQVFTSGWPFYLIGSVATLALLIYLVLRFLFGRFLGPKQHITVWFGYFSYFLICKLLFIFSYWILVMLDFLWTFIIKQFKN